MILSCLIFRLFVCMYVFVKNNYYLENGFMKNTSLGLIKVQYIFEKGSHIL